MKQQLIRTDDRQKVGVQATSRKKRIRCIIGIFSELAKRICREQQILENHVKCLLVSLCNYTVETILL